MTDPFNPQQPQDGPQYGVPGTGPQYGQPYGQQPYPGQPFAHPDQPYGQPLGQPAPYPIPRSAGPYGGDPEAPFGRDPFGVPFSDKSKLTAGLLQIFVGHFGVGRFYLGYTTIGVLQLITCGGCGIWSLIDGILMLTGKVPDLQGRPLRD